MKHTRFALSDWPMWGGLFIVIFLFSVQIIGMAAGMIALDPREAYLDQPEMKKAAAESQQYLRALRDEEGNLRRIGELPAYEDLTRKYEELQGYYWQVNGARLVVVKHVVGEAPEVWFLVMSCMALLVSVVGSLFGAQLLHSFSPKAVLRR
jgi:hypothetical protein